MQRKDSHTNKLSDSDGQKVVRPVQGNRLTQCRVQDIVDHSKSPGLRTDSHSHSPTRLHRDNEKGPPPNEPTQHNSYLNTIFLLCRSSHV